MATGAIWMVGFRVLEKSFGVISTLILARLLVPKDFGIVGMATSVIAFIELINSFGFDNALIQRNDADRRHFDTAFTLNVLLGVSCGLLIAAAAHPTATFYSEPGLVPVMLVLALATGIQGLENIGTVEFRRAMDFRREFAFLATKRILVFAVTIAAAFEMRSYWALVIGMLFGRAAAVMLSYVFHPYRPRWSLEKVSDLMSFSIWLLINNALSFLSSRLPHVFIGRAVGPAGLGVYTVAYEIATLPTSELLAPINRVIFPAFARISHDRSQLKLAMLDVLSATTFFAIPAAVGLAAVSGPLVLVCLGEKWSDAIPLMEVLAFTGGATALISCVFPAFLALGVPRVTTLIASARVLLTIPAMIFALKHFGLIGVAWAELAIALTLLPLTFAMAARTVGVSTFRMLERAWRPSLAALAMFWVVRQSIAYMVEQGTDQASLLLLVCAVGMGVVAYAGVVTILWVLAGCPAGIERRAWAQLRIMLNGSGAAA